MTATNNAASQLRLIGELQAKLQKQKNEIGRLTRHVAQLEADKRNLRFDLRKAEARIAQLTGVHQ